MEERAVMLLIAAAGAAAAAAVRPPIPASALPVIVAEIRVQRVHIETHSRGGAQQLRDHLSEPTQAGGAGEKNKVIIMIKPGKNRVPPSLLSALLLLLSIQPLGSAALQTTHGVPHDVPSVPKLAIFTPCHRAEGRVRAAAAAKRSPARCAAHPCAAVASVRASLRLGTGESRAGRRMWFSLGPSMRTGVCTVPGREGGIEEGREKK